MNPHLITAAVLFGPAATVGPTLAVTWWRHRGEHDAALTAIAEHYATRHQADPDQPPPDGGMPTPASDHLADVIPLPTSKRHAA